MPHRDDVLVIGGGIIGVCAAYYLAAQGRHVTLLEQDAICVGCSSGNAGLLVPSHSIPLAAPGVIGKALRWMLDPESPFRIRPRFDPELFGWLWRFRAACSARVVREAIPLLRDLHRASLALYERLAATEGLRFGYQRNGLLMLFRSARGHGEGVQEAALLREAGIESQVLDAAEVRAMVPRLSPRVVGGVYFPGDAQLLPAEFVQGLARVAAERGVVLRPSTEVLGFETSGPRVSTVKTTRGDFQPDHVVLAAGAWSSRLARDLRLRLPLQAVKGYSVTVTRPAPSLAVPLLLGEVKVAITPMDGTIRFAGTLELAGFELSINRRRVAAIMRAVEEYVPGLTGGDLVEIWRGLRPCTPDGLPIIGRPPQCENLIVATGHGMLGVSLGPITGMLVAQLLAEETPTVDLTAMGVDRFL